MKKPDFLKGVEKKDGELTVESLETILTNVVEYLNSQTAPAIEEEIQKLREEIKGKLNELKQKEGGESGADDGGENTVSEEEVKKRLGEFETKMDAFVRKIESDLKEKKENKVTLKEQFKKGVIEKKEQITRGEHTKIEIKAVSSAQLVVPHLNTVVDPTPEFATLRPTSLLEVIPSRSLRKKDYVKIAATSGVNVAYQNESTAVSVDPSTGSAGETTFMAAKMKAVVTGISTEALVEDTPELTSSILDNMLKQLRIFLEKEVVSGAGTQSPEKIHGIKTKFSTAFSNSGIPKVKAANILDLANAMRLQAQMGADDTEYNPDVLVVSPVVMYQLKTTKDTLDRPLMLEDKLGGTYRVVENRSLTADEMLLIDVSKIELHVGREFDMNIVQTSYELMSGSTVTGVYNDHDSDTHTAYAWFRGLLAMNPVHKAGNIYVSNIGTALTSITAV